MTGCRKNICVEQGEKGFYLQVRKIPFWRVLCVCVCTCVCIWGVGSAAGASWWSHQATQHQRGIGAVYSILADGPRAKLADASKMGHRNSRWSCAWKVLHLKGHPDQNAKCFSSNSFEQTSWGLDCTPIPISLHRF